MRRSLLCLFILLTAALLLFPSPALAEEEQDAELPTEETTETTTTTTRPSFEFVPVEAIPADVDLPYFYTKVESGMSLYIFMTADGTVHKRAYGSVNDVYGWYVVEGVDNKVYSPVPDADLYADMELYQASPWVYTGITTVKTNAGLLSPRSRVTSVDSLFGISIEKLFKILAAVTIAVCLVIVIAAGRNRRHIARSSAEWNRRRR